MRLIDADAKVVVTLYDEEHEEHLRKKMTVEEMLDAYTDGCPTVLSSERRTGHWILHESQRQEDVDNGNYLYICSECGKSDLHAKTQEVPFCWWCGAKMEVEHE